MEPSIKSLDIRKVSNGYILQFARSPGNGPAAFMGEERVFTSWNDVVAFLSTQRGVQ